MWDFYFSSSQICFFQSHYCTPVSTILPKSASPSASDHSTPVCHATWHRLEARCPLSSKACRMIKNMCSLKPEFCGTESHFDFLLSPLPHSTLQLGFSSWESLIYWAIQAKFLRKIVLPGNISFEMCLYYLPPKLLFATPLVLSSLCFPPTKQLAEVVLNALILHFPNHSFSANGKILKKAPKAGQGCRR